jgi:arsenate reductase (thioredoxin)
VRSRGLGCDAGEQFNRLVTVAQRKVLFLCIGNACRSQMAEGFARAYGKDELVPASAGLLPAASVPPLTVQVMKEKNISIEGAFPKDIGHLRGTEFDLIVNMSGQRLPPTLATRVEEWKVRDPIGQSEQMYREVRDEIEGKVMNLVLAIRMNKI